MRFQSWKPAKELQSVNEELTTASGELTARVEATAKSDEDWKNLLASAEIDTVSVDREARVKRFTPRR